MSQFRAALIAAKKNFKPPAPNVDPAVRKMGEILKANAGFAQAHIERAGLPYQCVRRYLRGEREAPIGSVRALLNELGYDLRVVRRTEE